MRRLITFSVGFFAAVFALFVFTPTVSAFAHDQLVDEFPADGEVLAESPQTIRLTFNNRLIDLGEGATVMNLIDASGEIVSTNTPKVDGMDAVLAVDGLEDGAYRLVWRVVSSDGHPITGTLTFAVGADGETALQELPPLDNSTPGDEQVENEENSFVLPLIVALVLAGAAAIISVLILTRRRSEPPTP